MTSSYKLGDVGRIREMFGRISGHCNLTNRLMTFGQDTSWRRCLMQVAALPPGGYLLDVGAGTGNIAREATKPRPRLRVVAVDFTFQMMQLGQSRSGAERVVSCSANALHLPFRYATFDAVASGYLIRNVFDVRQALEEQVVVVKPGGRVVCLDTAPPPPNILRPLVHFYLKVVIPFVGSLITRDRAAHHCMSKSTRAFIQPQELASVMRSIGLQDVSYEQFTLDTQVLYFRTRPKPA